MTSINKNLLSLTIKFGTASLVVGLFSAITNLFIAKFTDNNYYAIYVIFQSYTMIFVNIIGLGLAGCLIIYKNYSSEFEYSCLFNFGIFVVMPLVSLPALIYLNYTDIFNGYVQNTFTVCILMTTYVLVNSQIHYILTHEYNRGRFSRGLRVVILSSIINLITFCAWGYFKLELQWVLPLNIILLVSILINLYNKILVEEKYSKRLIPEHWKKYLTYSIPAALHAAFFSYLLNGDKLILSKLADPDTLAHYSYSATAACYFMFFVSNYASAWGKICADEVKTAADNEFLKKFNVGFVKTWIFIPFGIMYFPIVVAFSYCFPIVDFSIFLTVSAILLTSYVIHGANKYLLGYLHAWHRSEMMLTSGALSFIFFYYVTEYLYDRLGLVGVSYSVLLTSLIYIIINYLMCLSVIHRIRSNRIRL